MPQTIWEITLLSFFIREAYDLWLFTVGGFTLKHFNALRFNSGWMQEDGTWQPNYASTIKIFHSFKYFRLWKLVKVGFSKCRKFTVGCEDVRHLWQNEISIGKPPEGLHSFTSLRGLCITNCPCLVSFSDASLFSHLRELFGYKLIRSKFVTRGNAAWVLALLKAVILCNL